ncbi:MAG: hypothetical protein AAB408_04825 [Patescibacteria group bacterium]
MRRYLQKERRNIYGKEKKSRQEAQTSKTQTSQEAKGCEAPKIALQKTSASSAGVFVSIKR